MESQSQSAPNDTIHVALSDGPLNVNDYINRVKSPYAGAVVMFAGTTRNNFDNRPVARLSYVSYPALALKTLMKIATDVHRKHELVAIAIVHRLGEVPVGEESILVCVSAPHRKAAFMAGEEALEECKEKVEVWKREEFEDEGDAEGEKIWRANYEGMRRSQKTGP